MVTDLSSIARTVGHFGTLGDVRFLYQETSHVRVAPNA